MAHLVHLWCIWWFCRFWCISCFLRICAIQKQYNVNNLIYNKSMKITTLNINMIKNTCSDLPDPLPGCPFTIGGPSPVIDCSSSTFDLANIIADPTINIYSEYGDTPLPGGWVQYTEIPKPLACPCRADALGQYCSSNISGIPPIPPTPLTLANIAAKQQALHYSVDTGAEGGVPVLFMEVVPDFNNLAWSKCTEASDGNSGVNIDPNTPSITLPIQRYEAYSVATPIMKKNYTPCAGHFSENAPDCDCAGSFLGDTRFVQAWSQQNTCP